MIDPSGFLYFGWVIPYGIAVLAFLVVFRKFFLRLPAPIKPWFFASGAVYVAGAIGFEMLSARVYEMHGRTNAVYALYYTCEEAFEMLGVALFIFTLLRYACMTFGRVAVRITE